MSPKNTARIEELEGKRPQSQTCISYEYNSGLIEGIKEGAANEREDFLAWLKALSCSGNSNWRSIVEQRIKKLESKA